MYNYKYNKYISKMDNLIGGDKFLDNILFVHNTFGYDNLISILKSGVLKLGSKVEKERRKLSGGEPMDEIYMNIYFKDLKNLDNLYGLIFSSKLLIDYDLSVNAGWRGKTIAEIKKRDKMKEKKRKIKLVRKFLRNPKKILPEKVVEISSKIILHEVLFFEDIPLKDYLIGITNCGFTEEENNNIRKILEENKMNNVKFFY
jgi:hypothetical protein